MQTIEFSPGSHISDAVAALVAAAPAQGKFNDITIAADGTKTADEILAQWNADMEARRLAYEQSPEGVAARQQSDDERRGLQGRHDMLVQRLAHLDWKNDVSVLDWCCEMQAPSDRVGVIVKRQTIIAAFAANGFTPGMNTGKEYKDGDRNNMFRYLVGQALDGLQGPAIHPIIHKFAAEWKTRFGVAA